MGHKTIPRGSQVDTRIADDPGKLRISGHCASKYLNNHPNTTAIVRRSDSPAAQLGNSRTPTTCACFATSPCLSPCRSLMRRPRLAALSSSRLRDITGTEHHHDRRNFAHNYFCKFYAFACVTDMLQLLAIIASVTLQEPHDRATMGGVSVRSSGAL